MRRKKFTEKGIYTKNPSTRIESLSGLNNSTRRKKGINFDATVKKSFRHNPEKFKDTVRYCIDDVF